MQDEQWQPIETAPYDREIKLRAFIVPSDYAQQNGSKPHLVEASGRFMWQGLWSGILTGKPSHWMEIESWEEIANAA